MSTKLKLNFQNLNLIINQLKQLDGNIKKTTEKALVASHKIVTEKAENAIKPHRLTGVTEETLYQNAEVVWKGNVAEIPVGFSIRNGGIASVFLIYGTPRVPKDQALYNAFFGNATKKEISQAQENEFFEEIEKRMGL